MTHYAASEVQQPEADSGHDYSMPTPNVSTGDGFCLGLIGPATLSVAASELAVSKTTHAGTRQFANFELREAIAVTEILKSMNVPVPPMGVEGQALLKELAASTGRAFDLAYISAELANHEFLRDLAESYLKNATGPADVDEQHARHLAALALTAFKEHVVLTKDIARALRG